MELGPVAPAHDRTRVRVLGDGTRITPPAPQLPTQPPPYPPLQAAAADRARWAPWKLVVSLVVVAGLAAIGILVWMNGESTNTPVGAEATASSKSNATRPVPDITITPPSAAPAAGCTCRGTFDPGCDVGARKPARARSYLERPSPTRKRVAAAGAANGQAAPNSKSPATGAVPSGPAASSAAPVTSVPAGTAGSVASARPAPSSGKIQFSIKPWGEILIDGKSRGVSPPVKELAIPEGRHRIEIRNSTFPGYASDVEIKAGSNIAITHTFNAP